MIRRKFQHLYQLRRHWKEKSLREEILEVENDGRSFVPTKIKRVTAKERNKNRRFFKRMAIAHKRRNWLSKIKMGGLCLEDVEVRRGGEHLKSVAK